MKGGRNKETTGEQEVGASRREEGEGEEFEEVKDGGEKRERQTIYRARRRSMVGKRWRNENRKGREIHTCSLNCTTSAGVL